MAKATYYQRGEVIDYANSGAKDIPAGTIVAIGNRVGIAGTDIPVGAIGTLAVEGTYIMPKAASLAISAGDEVYFNTSNDNIDKTSSGVPAGYAVSDAGASDTEVFVKLKG